MVDKTGDEPVIWNEYKKIITSQDELFTIVKRNIENSIEMVERFQFYERDKNAFAVIVSGETAIYANIILKKEWLSSNLVSEKYQRECPTHSMAS